MPPLQERLAEAIREEYHADDAMLSYEVIGNAEHLAKLATVLVRTEMINALQQLPAINASSSRDFGRGYSMAITDAIAVLAEMGRPALRVVQAAEPATC